MAKITREPQKIFGGSLSPTNNIAVFGSLKAGTPTYSGDPSTIQSAAYSLGWADATVLNQAPALQDMNALFYNDSYQISYIFQTGLAEWDAATIYFIGSLVNDGLGGTFVSLTDTNTGNAITDGTKWSKISGMLARGISTTATIAYSDLFIEATGASNYTASLPAATALQNGKYFIIRCSTTAGAQVAVDVTGGGTVGGVTAISLLAGETVTVRCTGTLYEIIQYSTGTLIYAQLLSSSSQAMTTTTTYNIASISLPPGQWDLTGGIAIAPNGTNTVTFMVAGITATSASLPNVDTEVRTQLNGGTNIPNIFAPIPTLRKVIAPGSNVTYYLIARCDFSVGPVNGYGFIRAVRVGY